MTAVLLTILKIIGIVLLVIVCTGTLFRERNSR